jgi:serine protease Do
MGGIAGTAWAGTADVGAAGTGTADVGAAGIGAAGVGTAGGSTAGGSTAGPGATGGIDWVYAAATDGTGRAWADRAGAVGKTHARILTAVATHSKLAGERRHPVPAPAGVRKTGAP